MILHAYRRRAPSFPQLFDYLAREGRLAGPLLCHNLPPSAVPMLGAHAGDPESPAPDLTPIVDAFLENARHCLQRKNGVVLYQEILSLAPKDNTRVTPAILLDLAERYLALRAPDAMACGVIHNDRDHPHIHLVIAANLPGQTKKLRCSKPRFQAIKQALEAYQRARYPELTHSRVDHDLPKDPTRPRRQKNNTGRQTPARKQRKQYLREQVLTGIAVSDTLADFNAFLAAHHLALYERNGRPLGVVHTPPDTSETQKTQKGTKYRFTTLGLENDLKRAFAAWAQFPELVRPIDDALAEQFRQSWRRETGFLEDIRDVLEGPEEAHTSNHLERQALQAMNDTFRTLRARRRGKGSDGRQHGH